MDIHSKLYDDRSIGEIVNRTARLFRRLADQRLGPFGASAGHLPVLAALAHGDALSQKALTEYAGIEQPTMAAMLARMERDGSIVRRPDPRDKRAALFALTSSALARAESIKGAVGGLNSDALAGISRQDQQRLRDMLSAVANSIEKALELPPD